MCSTMSPTEITRCVNEYVTMLNKKDFPTLVDKFYRDTSKVMPPDGSMIMGKSEITKFMQNRWSKRPATMKGTWKIEETCGAGDCMTTVGTYCVMDGTKPMDSGRLITIWKMGPDGCKIQTDSFSTCPTPCCM